MNYLDDLPKRDQNHVHDTMAKTAFEAFIASSGVVLKQSSDDNDYGTDYQLEIMHDGMATNVRLQVQLKVLLQVLIQMDLSVFQLNVQT